jgi:predicted nucleotidyltransferase
MSDVLAIIHEHMSDLIALCEEFGVARLEVFGSATTSSYDHLRSDIDFLVTFPPGYDYGPWLSRYVEFKERLSDLFGRPVDLVESRDFENPYFARAVEESRRLVYAA